MTSGAKEGHLVAPSPLRRISGTNALSVPLKPQNTKPDTSISIPIRPFSCYGSCSGTRVILTCSPVKSPERMTGALKQSLVCKSLP
jgi:hypothetical protein